MQRIFRLLETPLFWVCLSNPIGDGRAESREPQRQTGGWRPFPIPAGPVAIDEYCLLALANEAETLSRIPSTFFSEARDYGLAVCLRHAHTVCGNHCRALIHNVHDSCHRQHALLLIRKCLSIPEKHHRRLGSGRRLRLSESICIPGPEDSENSHREELSGPNSH